jgi:hypothetical protein
MDAIELKMFAQLDDDAPAQRVNALEMLRERMKQATPPRKFRDLVKEFVDAIQVRQELETRYAAAMQANAGLAQQLQKAIQENAWLKRMLAIRDFVKPVVVIGILIAIPLVSYYFVYARPAAAARESVRERIRATEDAAFHTVAKKTIWQNTAADGDPFIWTIADTPYWVIPRWDEDRTTHRDSQGHPVTVQCVHIFAEQAEPHGGAYREPRPYALWGWGWMTWDERAVDCQTDIARRVRT